MFGDYSFFWIYPCCNVIIITGMRTTNYFITSVIIRRPYLKKEWIEYVLNNPIRVEKQPNNRIRHWAFISEAQKYLRVVTEPDGQTVHNAFFDRSFKP